MVINHPRSRPALYQLVKFQRCHTTSSPKIAQQSKSSHFKEIEVGENNDLAGHYTQFQRPHRHMSPLYEATPQNQSPILCRAQEFLQVFFSARFDCLRHGMDVLCVCVSRTDMKSLKWFVFGTKLPGLRVHKSFDPCMINHHKTNDLFGQQWPMFECINPNYGIHQSRC